MAHALGLPHSFVASETDAASRFTFMAKSTDNILDYSHIDSNARFSLWYWQMQKMWEEVDSCTANKQAIPTQRSNEIDVEAPMQLVSTPRI